MLVASVNISNPQIIKWNGQSVTTGIYKRPVEHSIFLEPEKVRGDTIADLNVHGGFDKACYLYSTDHYEHWKRLYPDLEWTYGMFGENITVSGLDEDKLKLGAKYQLGTSLVAISQPRQPCYKLGVKFGSQKILREFIQFGHPGTYVRILKPGEVKKGDELILVEQSNEPSIQEVFSFMYKKG